MNALAWDLNSTAKSCTQNCLAFQGKLETLCLCHPKRPFVRASAVFVFYVKKDLPSGVSAGL
jgi:hypothetical protein